MPMEEVLVKKNDSYMNHRSHLFSLGSLAVISLLIMPIACPLIIGYGLYKVLNYKNTHIEISNKRITIEHGILSRTLNTLELWKVNDIQISQNLPQRLLGEAYLVLITQDRLTPSITIEALTSEEARSLFKPLQDHIAQARRDNRVTQFTT